MYKDQENRDIYRSNQNAIKKIVLFNLFKEMGNGKCICGKCKREIVNYDHLTINHIKPWRQTQTRVGDTGLFWSLDNYEPCHACCNLPDSTSNKNGYRGIHKNVYKNTGNFLYQACISMNNKTIILGYSKRASHAAKYYDLGIMKYRKGAGVLNFEVDRQRYIKILQRKPNVV